MNSRLNRFKEDAQSLRGAGQVIETRAAMAPEPADEALAKPEQAPRA